MAAWIRATASRIPVSKFGSCKCPRSGVRKRRALAGSANPRLSKTVAVIGWTPSSAAKHRMLSASVSGIIQRDGKKLVSREIAADGRIVIARIRVGGQELDLILNLGKLVEPFGAKVKQIHAALMVERQLDGANGTFVGAQVVQPFFEMTRVLRGQFAVVQLLEGVVDLLGKKLALMKDDKLGACRARRLN